MLMIPGEGMIPGKRFGGGFDWVLFFLGIVKGLTVQHLKSMQDAQISKFPPIGCLIAKE